MSRWQKFTPLVAFLALGFGAKPAAGESLRYEEPIRYRQAVMVMSKRHFEQLASISKGKLPFNRDEVIKHATYLDLLAQVSLDGFVAGSHEGDTRAKPEIWRDWSNFRALNDKYRSQTTRLRLAANTLTSADALKPLLSDLTTSCKSCHDDFKKSAVGS